MEATILLLGWEPVNKGFEERLLHRERNLILNMSVLGNKGYCTESDTRQIGFLDSAVFACEMLTWTDMRVECFYNRVMEIEHDTQNRS